MDDLSQQVDNSISPVQESSPVASAKGKRQWAEWFTAEHCLNGLLLASVVQLVLSILLYVLAAIQFKVLLIEAGVMIVLALLSHKLNDEFRWRVILRVLYVAVLVLVLVGGAAMMVLIVSQSAALGSHDQQQAIFANFLMITGILALPALLFLQPAMVAMVQGRYRFDLVLLRITAIAVLLLSIVLCVFGLEYTMNGERMIINSVRYSPVIFGHTMNITIAIDNILTRILFCLCSIVMVVFSFKLRSLSRAKTHRDKKRRGQAK